MRDVASSAERAAPPGASPNSQPSGQPWAAEARGAPAAGLLAASKFLGRLSLLDLAALGSAVHAWRETVSAVDGGWFAAEGAIPEGVAAARRYPEQGILLRHMTDLFLRTPWFTAAQPGTRIGAAEPAAQYVATTAMLAVLVRDRLAPAQFEVLYRPFATLIPVDSLVRE